VIKANKYMSLPCIVFEMKLGKGKVKLISTSVKDDSTRFH